MSGKITFITEESFNEFASTAPNSAIVMIYSITRYHEKFLVTAWAMKELEKRGFNKKDLDVFDTQFSNFYYQLLNQEGL